MTKETKTAMSNCGNGPELLDKPEIISRLFFPRKEFLEDVIRPKAMSHFLQVDEGVSIGCRFYPANKEGHNILYFHGNGETVLDYDYIAPLYNERGINLFVADYRGYGYSNGNPTCAKMIEDAHSLFHGFVKFLKELSYQGKMFVAGRSLGSAPAIEVAFYYQKEIKGLIIESGFSGVINQISRLGVTQLFSGIKSLVGFGNDKKIKEICIPTLIIHGEKDNIIPFAEGKELYDLCGSEKKELVLIKGAGHNDLMMVGTDQYFGAIENFVRLGT